MSLISALQLKTIQIARRHVESASNGVFDEPQWRMTLLNVGGVKPDGDGRVSSKRLDQRGFELVMAFLEERGYREPNRAPDHWRKRPGVRVDQPTTRQLREIRDLAVDSKYPLASLVRQISSNRVDQVERLTGAQGYKLIEMLKAISDRSRKEAPDDLTPVGAATTFSP